jgi:prepilin-type processing-associated H-X9-DG protein
MINYTTHAKYFPGFMNQLKSTCSTTTYLVSWIVEILPEIEKTDLREAIQQYGMNDSANLDLNAHSLAILSCPSDPPPAGPYTSFVVNRGINGLNDRAYGVCMNNSGTYTTTLPSFQGFCSISSLAIPLARVSPDYISSHDGMAYTLLVAENSIENAPAGTFPRAANDRAATAKWNQSHSTTTDYKDDINYSAEIGLGFNWGYATPTASGFSIIWIAVSDNPKLTDRILTHHSGNCINVSYCDGHNQVMNADLDPTVYKHLMTPWSKKIDQSVLPGIFNESAANTGG